MNIRYLGHSSFLIEGSTGKVVTDPYDSVIMKHSFPKVEADIVTISHQHKDHNASHSVHGDPLVVNIPGEYEKKGIRIYGFETYHDKQMGAERGKNTMFKIVMDEVSILHCGDLGHVLSKEIIEEVDGVDILMIPVGGNYTINADEARDIVSKVEPYVVIPMHYKSNAGFDEALMSKLQPVSDFIEKIGVTDIEPVKKFSYKRNDEDEMSVVVMEVS